MKRDAGLGTMPATRDDDAHFKELLRVSFRVESPLDWCLIVTAAWLRAALAGQWQWLLRY